MRYLSCDLETTGTNLPKDQILEIGLVAVDTNTHPSTWNTFHAIIDHPRTEGTSYAIALNGRIFDFLKRYHTEPDDVQERWLVLKPEELLQNVLLFVEANGYKMEKDHYTLTLAGKNVAGFDIPFMKYHFNRHNGTNFVEANDVPGNISAPIRFRRRVIDPTILFTDFVMDSVLPDLGECKKRAGLSNIVTHNALEDALDIVYLVCSKMGYDFNKTITDKKLNDIGKSYFIENSPYIYWNISSTRAIRLSKDLIGNKNYEPKNLFRMYEMGDFLVGDWKYIWNMKEIDIEKSDIYYA